MSRIDIGLKVPIDATSVNAYAKRYNLYSQIRDIMAVGVRDATDDPNAARAIQELYEFNANVLLTFFLEQESNAAENDSRELVGRLIEELNISHAVLSTDSMESWELLVY